MSRSLPPRFEVKIEKMNMHGQGVGRFQNRQARVWGAVPGDRLLVRPLKKKRGLVEAGLVEVLEPAADRRPPRDTSYLSSSPWQVIKDEKQLEYKKEMVLSAFKDIAGALPAARVELIASPRLFNYRHKMEYSFCPDPDGRISLALHQRNCHRLFYGLNESAIAARRINECGRIIADELNRAQIDIRSLKNLLIRYSQSEDKCLAGLFVTDADFPRIAVDHPILAGFHILYSDPLSPTAVNSRPLLETGASGLTEAIGKFKFSYNFQSFFQINPPAFADLLEYLRAQAPPARRLVDLYAGVGVIGLGLADRYGEVVLVESDPLATVSAEANIRQNRIDNARVITGLSEKLDLGAWLERADALIVDPPRSGLHPRALKEILRIRPRHFIYVSCNPLTQARDFREIRRYYRVLNWRLFDMYPQTPHCESVIVMKRKFLR